jgi:hypothetical protein
MNLNLKIYLIFVIIGVIIVLCAYLTIDPNIEKFDIEYKIIYPDKNEISNKLVSGGYFNFFKLLDAQARNIKFTQTAFEEKYNSSIIEIDENEKNNFNKFYQDVVELIPIKKRHQLLIPNLKIAKFSGIENEYPHTHEDIIFFNKDVFNSLNNYQSKSNNQLSLAKTLIHEIFHIKQRETPVLYDNLFHQWGFQSVSIQYLNQNLSSDVISRIRINPDELPNYRFWVWKNKMMPLVVYSSTDVSGINDIMYIAIDWKNKKKYTYLEDYIDFSDYFKIKNNHYHPNEILAEYQAIYFMELTNNIKNTDILQSEGYKLFKQNLK